MYGESDELAANLISLRGSAGTGQKLLFWTVVKCKKENKELVQDSPIAMRLSVQVFNPKAGDITGRSKMGT